jgi:hypothetical protein
MVAFLFPRFLKNAREYEKAQRLWQSQWQDLVARAGQTDHWECPWLNTAFADGTPCRDGNPIFSAVNRQDSLGIRVIQLEPRKAAEISHWTDEFGQGSDAIRELVISCALTEQALQKAVALMNDWVIRKTERQSSAG